MPTLAQTGERAFIERLTRRLPSGAGVICGIGDDAAVVRPNPTGDDLLLTSDAVLAGRHFDVSAPPVAIGHKAVGRVLSDLAAMGGQPRWALINLVAPGSLDLATLDGIYAGAAGLGGRHGMALVGGDTTEGDRLELHVFAVGSVPQNGAVLRSGAKVGDVVMVTGRLGGSRHGRHQSFEPRVAEGQWLRSWVSSMIDVSDGVATDIHHLAAGSGTGTILDAASIPIHADARADCDDHAALMHALNDGEDYELLFTVAPDRVAALQAAWSLRWPVTCTRIGVMTAAPGSLMLRHLSGSQQPLLDSGFEHYSHGKPSP